MSLGSSVHFGSKTFSLEWVLSTVHTHVSVLIFCRNIIDEGLL
jgi:hypothetical protein